MPAEIDFLVGDPVAAPPVVPKRGAAPVKDDSDDDAAFIAEASQRRNVKAGTEVAKQAQKAKGKASKTASGVTTGGGSFQSMGTWRDSPRLASLATALAALARLYDADAHPAACHPGDSRTAAAGRRRHGAHG